MELEKEKTRKIHHGQNLRCLREMRGKKQSTLAQELSVSQQYVSQIEQTEILDDETLGRFAVALEVSIEAIKNFNPEATINLINDIHHFENHSIGFVYHNHSNPDLEKVVELYERLLASEREKIELLKKAIKD